MRYRNKVLMILAIAVFITGLSFSAMASFEPIKDVSIDINMRNDEDDVDVNVTTNSDKYYLDKAFIVNEEDYDYMDGDQPILKVYLKPYNNYTFSTGFAPKNVSITGSRGTIVGGRVTESDLKILIVLNPDKDDVGSFNLKISNLKVGDLEWNEMDGTAKWKTTNDVSHYELLLYRGGSRITPTLITSYPNFDFSAYITEEGDYSYKVRAVSDTGVKGKWKKSISWHVNSDEAGKISYGKIVPKQKGPGRSISDGTWLNDQTGWKYRNENGSNTVSSWQQIDNKWYYFNESGYMETGWIYWKEKWYYCGEDGAMKSNTMTPDGYQLGNDGVWLK